MSGDASSRFLDLCMRPQPSPEVNVIRPFHSSLSTLRQNKLQCLPLASIFHLAEFSASFLPLTLVEKYLPRTKHSSLFGRNDDREENNRFRVKLHLEADDFPHLRPDEV